MKKLIPILLAVFALASCEKDPDMGNWMTIIWYTLTTTESRFQSSYILSGTQILVISDSKEPDISR